MDYMQLALKQAQKAMQNGEVPVGAVIVHQGKVISHGYNKREKNQNALLHAEIVAIDKACKKLKSWRLNDCDMYVTLEPCPMCAGAILNSRIKTVHIAAKDKNYGAVISKYQLLNENNLNHQTQVFFGEKQTESENLLKNFFIKIRNKKI